MQQTEEDCDYSFKIVLVGECDVGKTCIWQFFIKGITPKKTAPTIGVEFETKLIALPDGSRVKAQIWDTAGQERYRGLTSNHFRKAVGALVVFDLTNKETFDKLKTWVETLKSQAENDIQILLVGNKLDLLQKNPESRQVKEEDAKQLAKTYRCKYVEISAYTPENVTMCFETLLSGRNSINQIFVK